ncbi:MAG: ABC transporter ATP-binding protein [Acidobacteriota bacterium]
MSLTLETKSLSVKRSRELVLNDVSFGVEPGEIYALLGGNGAGKSTTLLTFLGFLEPSAGEVLVHGKSVSSHLASSRQAISYLPEAATLYGHLDAYQNLAYFLSLANVKTSRVDLDSALETVSLESDARAKRMDTYSKGMRQKVAIALALLRGTPILLLDEPTSGLDPIAIDEFHGLVRDLAAQGKTVLMVTHDVYGACQVADRIGLLRRGELVGAFARSDEGTIETEAVHAAFAGRDAP